MSQMTIADDIVTQLYELWRRWRLNRKGLRISLPQIQESFETYLEQPVKDYLAHRGEHHKEKIIFSSSFMEIVPNLGEEQHTVS